MKISISCKRIAYGSLLNPSPEVVNANPKSRASVDFNLTESNSLNIAYLAGQTTYVKRR